MQRLDTYRLAMLAAIPDVTDDALNNALDAGRPGFPQFIIDHGLGPLWHSLTGQDEFRESRRQAEALYLAQAQALGDIDGALNTAGIPYAVIKGAANRLLLFDNPAVRSCFDLDILVRPEDRVAAAQALSGAGFEPQPNVRNISRELVLSRNFVDIDLHWGLLREGRLRTDPTSAMLDRRIRAGGIWMLSAEDALFVLLVHPAFAKHLAGWTMGLHRVADLLLWLQKVPFDSQVLLDRLAGNGVRTAAWSTLRWMQLLTEPYVPSRLEAMLADFGPGRLRKAWLDNWLRKDLSERTSSHRWSRLIGFSMFLHDKPFDALRVLAGRHRAHRRVEADLAAFQRLLDQ